MRDLAQLLRYWDESGRLGELFDRPKNLTDAEAQASVEEESWTLGSQSLEERTGSLLDIQEFENKLSEVVERAIDSGPQILTRHGAEVAVVLSYPEYLQLKRK